MATALADAGMDQFNIKCALNHKDNTVTGVYDRSYHIKAKSKALSKWHAIIIEDGTIEAFKLRAV
jgi:hypothetical protein